MTGGSITLAPEISWENLRQTDIACLADNAMYLTDIKLLIVSSHAIISACVVDPLANLVHAASF